MSSLRLSGLQRSPSNTSLSSTASDEADPATISHSTSFLDAPDRVEFKRRNSTFGKGKSKEGLSSLTPTMSSAAVEGYYVGSGSGDLHIVAEGLGRMGLMSPAAQRAEGVDPKKCYIDRIPSEILIHIFKHLPASSLPTALLVSPAFLECAVELLYHKPAFSSLSSFYHFCSIIDPSCTVPPPQAQWDPEEDASSTTSAEEDEPEEDLDGEDVSLAATGSGSTTFLASLPSAGLSHRVPIIHSNSSSSSSASTSSTHTTQMDHSSLPHAQQTFPYASFPRRLNLSSPLFTSLPSSAFLPLRLLPRLERLTLASCNLLTDDDLAVILNGMKASLVALDLSGVKGVGKATIKALSKCAGLQGVNLSGCVNVGDKEVVRLAKGCPGLRRIKLHSLQLTTPSILFLARLCPLLLEIDLVSVSMLTSASVRELWLRCLGIRELRLSGCQNIGDDAFPLMVASNDEDGAGEVPHSMWEDLENPTRIKLNLDDDELVEEADDNGAYEPAQLKALLDPELAPATFGSHFDHLRILDLTSCSTITDTAISHIISNAPRIRSLVLAKCGNLTDASIESISKLGKSLHQLYMGHCGLITDKGVTKLARGCGRLRYIDLACCPLLTDISVLELASLSKLRRIGLVRVSNLTDNAIHALVERPSPLERIHLSYCENISVEAIHHLLQKLRRLTHLSLTGVPAFKRNDLQKFCRNPPKEFNAHQRQAFCVYSSSGVSDLRQYLLELHTYHHSNENKTNGSFTQPGHHSRQHHTQHHHHQPRFPLIPGPDGAILDRPSHPLPPNMRDLTTQPAAFAASSSSLPPHPAFDEQNFFQSLSLLQQNIGEQPQHSNQHLWSSVHPDGPHHSQYQHLSYPSLQQLQQQQYPAYQQLPPWDSPDASAFSASGSTETLPAGSSASTYRPISTTSSSSASAYTAVPHTRYLNNQALLREDALTDRDRYLLAARGLLGGGNGSSSLRADSADRRSGGPTSVGIIGQERDQREQRGPRPLPPLPTETQFRGYDA